MVFMGVSQHAEFDFDVRFARGDAHMLHPENTPEFNLKVALSPPGVLLVLSKNDLSRVARENVLKLILSKTTSRRVRADFEIHRKLNVKITNTLRLFYFMRTLTP